MKLAQFFLLLLVMLFSLQAVFAANGNDTSKRQKLNFEQLQLELSTPKRNFLLLEPIQLTVTLKNNLEDSALRNLPAY